MKTNLWFSCEPNGHVGKNPLQFLSFKIPLSFLQSKGSLSSSSNLATPEAQPDRLCSPKQSDPCRQGGSPSSTCKESSRSSWPDTGIKIDK
jgi:hypothetical protein